MILMKDFLSLSPWFDKLTMSGMLGSPCAGCWAHHEQEAKLTVGGNPRLKPIGERPLKPAHQERNQKTLVGMGPSRSLTASHLVSRREFVVFAGHPPRAVLVDLFLPDGDDLFDTVHCLMAGVKCVFAVGRTNGDDQADLPDTDRPDAMADGDLPQAELGYQFLADLKHIKVY